MPSSGIEGPSSLTKGIQGSSGFSVQDLKDSGRTYVMLYALQVAGVAAETLITLQINQGGVVTSGTSFTVPANKIFRLQAISISSTVGNPERYRLRSDTVVLATSPIIWATQTNGHNTQLPIILSIPDGIEIASGKQVGLSHIGTGNITDYSINGFLY